MVDGTSLYQIIIVLNLKDTPNKKIQLVKQLWVAIKTYIYNNLYHWQTLINFLPSPPSLSLSLLFVSEKWRWDIAKYYYDIFKKYQLFCTDLEQMSNTKNYKFHILNPKNHCNFYFSLTYQTFLKIFKINAFNAWTHAVLYIIWSL